jgi:hypothetical protein
LTSPTQAKTKTNLAFIRLLPSTWLSYLYNQALVGYPLVPGTTYGYDRSFTDYQDLVSELNLACANDTSNGSSPGTTPNFYANDIQFGYDQRTNRIYFTGLTAGRYYVPASYEDPNITNISSGTTGFNVLQTFQLLTSNPAIGAGTFYSPSGQDYNPFRPLSLRLGWDWNNQATVQTNYLTTASGVKNYAFTYADLVYSSDVYIYVSFVGASSLDSAGNSGLLSVVPLNTPNNANWFLQ